MNYTDWEKGVPNVIRDDSLWTVEAYRLSLFLGDISWNDAVKLSKNSSTRSLSDQLYRSAGSISANIEEGYSKYSSKDRARFYEYSLGSARETRGWFYRARHVLSNEVSEHQMEITTQIIRLLTKMVPDQRGYKIKEDEPDYIIKTNYTEDVLF